RLPSRLMRTLITGTIVLVRLALAAPASGQRPDSLRDTARIAPVVVTATSTPLALNRVPASVTVLDGATLRAEALTHVAGAPRASLDARGGTYTTYDVDATADAPIGGGRASFGAGHHITNGFYDFNSRYRNDVGNASLTLAPWTGAELVGTGRYNDAIAHFPTDFTGAPVDPNAYRLEKRALLGAELRQQIARTRTTLGLTSNLANDASIDPPNGPGDFGSSLTTRTLRQTADLRVAVPFASQSTLTVGGAAERQHEAAPNYDRRNSAVYVELMRTAGLTTATAGARLDHSGTFGDFATYRLSASRLLPAAWRARASLGTAFREPSFFESFDTPF